MKSRLLLRVAVLCVLACSVVFATGASRGTAAETCPAEVRHFPAPGTEAPGTFDITLVAASPRAVVAQWEAYSDRGFLVATLPELRLDVPAGAAKPGAFPAQSRTVVIRLPAGTKVYESWVSRVAVTEGQGPWIADAPFACFPPQGDPRVPRVRPPLGVSTPTPGPTPDPAIAPVVATVLPDVEKMDCPKPFVNAQVLTMAPLRAPFPGTGNATALVKVTVGPRGQLADATIFHSSGDLAIDAAAVRAAQASTYAAPIAFCRPVFGSYVLRMDFSS
jgi:TonB family protein